MKNDESVVVTGIGVVSPYGVGLDAYWSGLLSGISKVQPLPQFSRHNYRSSLGAPVPDAIAKNAESGWGDKATGFLAMAVKEALSMANAGPVFKYSDRVGCVVGSLCAGIDNLISIADTYHNNRPQLETLPTDAAQVNHQLRYITQTHNLTGPSSMVSTACASTTDAIGFGFDLIKNKECDAVIVGGGDTLAELIHAGFNSLFSITTTQPRPFDSSRDGFAIGEGGGALFLESSERARCRGAKPLAKIMGYGLSNTAFHLTATSEDGYGEALSIARALEDAKVLPSEVHYINTHGTATKHNDRSEMLAMHQVFGSHIENILASSNKPLIGHCMGAAGIMEAICTIQILREQMVPPTPFTLGNEPLRGFDLVMSQTRKAKMDVAISESFGFGGACSCVVFGSAG
jgi:3-oxoacyl-[acyl-carrier-protein] synthase II